MKKWMAILVFTLLFQSAVTGAPVAHADPEDEYITFLYEGFASAADRLKLNRDAAVSGDRLRLTPALTGKGGTVFNNEKVSLKDDRSFSTYFSFEISGSVAWNGGPRGGDGLVFTVQTFDNTVSSIGGTLGYAGIDQSIGVKFDTWENREDHNDTSDNNMALLMNGDIDFPLVYLDMDKDTMDFMTGQIHVWVDYNGQTGLIEVRVNKNSNVRPVDATISYTMAEDERLTQVLQSNLAYVGFTATTGGSRQNHDILNWYFTNEYNPIDVNDPNKQYKQAPTDYTIQIEEGDERDDGAVELDITVTGADANFLPLTVTASDGAAVTPGDVTTDENGRAAVIVSSPDGSMRTSTVTVTGPGGIHPTSEVISIPGRTAPPLAENIIANATDGEVTVKGVPVGATVKVYNHEDNEIASAADVTDGEAQFTGVTGLSTANPIQVSFRKAPQAESVKVAVTPKVRSDALAEDDLAANATTDEVTVKGVPAGAVIRVYEDVGGLLIGSGENEGASAAEVVVAIDDPGLADLQVVYVTIQKTGEWESLTTAVTAELETSAAPADVQANADTDVVVVKAVPAGADVRVYDGDGGVIGTGSNADASPRDIAIDLGAYDLQVGESVYVSWTESDKRESSRVESVALGQSAAPDADDLTADGTAGEVTVRDVPPGATVIVYDEDGQVLGSGSPSGGSTDVVIGGLDLELGEDVRVTVTEPGKLESEPTPVAVTYAPSDPPEAIDANATRDVVTVPNVPAGATVTVYDTDGNVIGTAVRPGPGAGAVAVTVDTPPGLARGQQVDVTITELKKTESDKARGTAYWEASRKPVLADVLDLAYEGDPGAIEITVGHVPPGANVVFYDSEDREIGRATNGDPAAEGEVQVVLTDVPPGATDIGIAYLEPEKEISEMLVVNLKTKTEELIDDAIRELEVEFTPGDTWESVTSPLFVVTVGKHHTAVDWTSGNSDVIRINEPAGTTIEASIVRQPADVSVILTAYVTKNGVTKTRTFLVVVKAEGLTKETEPTRRTVEVSGGEDGAITAAVGVDRIKMSNGSRIDKVIFDAVKADEFIQDPQTSGGIASLYVDADPVEEADEIAVEIPGEALARLHQNGNTLEVRTDYGSLTIANAVLEDMVGQHLDLFFRIVPVKDADRQQEITERVLADPEVKKAAGDRLVEVLGSSLELETNYSDYRTTLFIPFAKNGIVVPPGNAAAFLNSLRVFIEHSDGEKVPVKGTGVLDSGGTPIGLAIEIDKFSTFTIIQLKDRPAGGSSSGSSESSGTPDKPEPPEEDRTGYHEAYVKGYPDGLFRPDRPVTRAEMSALLAQILNLSASSAYRQLYPDVAEEHWAAAYIEQLTALGLFNGDPQGRFRPDRRLTRAELAVIAAKWLQADLTGSTVSPFPDVPSSHWAAAAIAFAADKGVLIGYPDGTFRADEPVTRAQAVATLNRLLGRGPLAHHGDPAWPDVPRSHWAFGEIEDASHDHFYTLLPDGSEEILQL